MLGLHTGNHQHSFPFHSHVIKQVTNKAKYFTHSIETPLIKRWSIVEWKECSTLLNIRKLKSEIKVGNNY